MCTVFRTNKNRNGNFFVGKNYDVPDPCMAMIFLNIQGAEKQALIMPPEIPVKWKSKYGSITCSQMCKDFPSSGMNEVGLIVEQTTLWNTIYPDRDERPAIKELQWIQLMLDTCATTEEVIKKSKEVRISQNAAKIQYFICDALGDVCLIQYILGDMLLIRGDDLKYSVITNDMYNTSIDYLNIHEGYGGKKVLVKSDISVDRFAVTVNDIVHNEYIKIEDAFSILDLSAFSLTQLSIVYDPVNMFVSYRSKNSSEIKSINISRFDFAKMSVPLIKEVDDTGNEFLEFSKEKNYELIKYFFTESCYFKNIRVTEKDMEMLAQL